MRSHYYLQCQLPLFFAIISLLLRQTKADTSSATCMHLLAVSELPSYEPITLSLLDDTSSIDPNAWETALSDGLFQVPIPNNLKNALNPSTEFAKHWHLNENFTTGFNEQHPEFKNDPLQGYMVGQNHPLPGESITSTTQVRRLNLKSGPENHHWQYFPAEVESSLNERKKTAIHVLNRVLDEMGIEATQRHLVTGGVSQGEGDYYAVANHYDPKQTEGLRAHTDYGFITLLETPLWPDENCSSERSGLEVLIKDRAGKQRWMSVNAKEGHLIFQFGATAEKTTALLERHKIHAPIHRAHTTQCHRTSLALFSDPSYKSTIYNIEPSGKLKPMQRYAEHVNELNTALYEEKSCQFGS